jgi:hypothetical protein
MPNTHSHKVCGICGMSRKDNWARHWKTYHPGAIRQELPPGGVPTEPFNEDWLKSIEPKSLRDKYKEAAKIYEEVPPTLKVDTHAEATLLFDSIVDNDVDDIEIDVEEDERED